MVPRRDDCPVTGIVSKANFVTANAVDTILAVPRRVSLPPVNYLEKEDYGKVPKYLQQVYASSSAALPCNEINERNRLSTICLCCRTTHCEGGKHPKHLQQGCGRYTHDKRELNS